MKKTYQLENLDCANCAMKMERSIQKIDGVHSVSINFIMHRLDIDADDANFDDILQKVQKAIKKVDYACKIVK